MGKLKDHQKITKTLINTSRKLKNPNFSPWMHCFLATQLIIKVKMVHQEVCGILLSSLESLQQAYIEFSDLLHAAPMMGLERIKSKVKVTDCRKRLHQLSDSVKVKN